MNISYIMKYRIYWDLEMCMLVPKMRCINVQISLCEYVQLYIHKCTART